MKIGIVGLGLIGASFAKAYRGLPDYEVLGYDLNETVSGFSTLSQTVDGILDDGALPQCELLILATYPGAAKTYLKNNAHKLSKNTLVMDTLGTKTEICRLGFALAKEYGFTFVGGHPMAGSEHSGIRYAREDLFENASMVLVPPDGDDIALLVRMKKLLAPLHFGSFQVTTAEAHDLRIGYTSQLPHLLSNALVQSPTAEAAQGFSGGSFRDMTRVAELNSKMWTELFLENRENLLNELNILLASLSDYQQALEAGDAQKLAALLQAGTERKKALSHGEA